MGSVQALKLRDGGEGNTLITQSRPLDDYRRSVPSQGWHNFRWLDMVYVVACVPEHTFIGAWAIREAEKPGVPVLVGFCVISSRPR